MANPKTSDGVSLTGFTERDHAQQLNTYIRALEAFDATAGIQELKALSRERTGIGPGRRVLDVGCGFGLETLRAAERVAPSGTVAGLDLSRDFIVEAQRRADAAGLKIDLRVGSAEALPFADAAFDIVRAERLLIYLHQWQTALAEIRRTVRPGGRIALIEPDISTTTVNIPDRALLRRIMAHEADMNVVNAWLPGPLSAALRSLNFVDVALATRVVVFPAELGRVYFGECGRSACEAGVIGADELVHWQVGLDALHASGQLFGTVSYFLFNATRPAEN
ncbi:MAG: methyltransferase domain-containing protein [Proteobacteria bacterium]|nr:methyltransferase domain-containing protein [Pseudomonadota bacterium]